MKANFSKILENRLNWIEVHEVDRHHNYNV
jgi:hypothetical protein